jgi:CheY-like chemotaxis protein
LNSSPDSSDAHGKTVGLEDNSFAHEEHFLFVDDDANDLTLASIAWKRVNPALNLRILCDGEEAIRYLQGDRPYDNRAKFPLPSVMLLDLKMPKCSGFEVLEWRKRNTAFRELPVVVLSAWANTADCQKAHQLGADWYFAKPAHFKQWVDLISTLTEAWLNFKELPPFHPREPSSLQSSGA